MSIIQSIGNKNGGSRGKIKSSSHCIAAIEYIRREDKAYKIFYQNCRDGSASMIADDFKNVRLAFNKNNGIICHHYYQSFPKDEKITPEQAHEYAKEFAQKVWKDYQVIISTHIDRDHLHSHFIVNNINLSTGKKFADNKKTLSELQSANDDLCKKHNLSVLGLNYETKKYKGINAATRETSKRKQSWKVELAIALRSAIENPEIKNQNDFDKFLAERNFTANYDGMNITILKAGEKKCIRLNTLAKEAGEIFGQDNIVKRFKIDHVLIGESKNKNKSKTVRQNFSKEEHEYFKSHQPQYVSVKVPIIQKRAAGFAPVFKSESKSKSENHIVLKSVFQILLMLLFSRRSRIFLSRLSFERKKYRKSYPSEETIKNSFSYVGNVDYKALKNFPDENIRIKIYAHQLPLLCNQPFFYSAKVNHAAGIAEVTLKKHNVKNLASALGLRADYYSAVVDEKENIAKYRRIKKASGAAVNFIVIDEEKLKALKSNRLWNLIDIAYFKNKKDNKKYNIAFETNNKKLILDVIYPDHKQEISEVINAREINKRLKAKAAAQGVRLCYKIITKEQLEGLSSAGNIEFAAFFKEGDKYNAVFLPEQERNIRDILAAGAPHREGGKMDAKGKTI